jgi:hypothetical protein
MLRFCGYRHPHTSPCRSSASGQWAQDQCNYGYGTATAGTADADFCSRIRELQETLSAGTMALEIPSRNARVAALQKRRVDRLVNRRAKWARIDHRLKGGGHRGWSSGRSADLVAPLVRLEPACQSGQWGPSGDRRHHPAPGRLFAARESLSLLFASNRTVMATQAFFVVDPGASTIVLFFAASTIFFRLL